MKHIIAFILVIALGSFAGCSPLRSAVYKGDNRTVVALLDKGADVNENFQGESVLVVAAISGHMDTVRLLLDRGASVNASQGGRTALFYAAAQGNTDMAKLLIDRGADVDLAVQALTKGGRTDAVSFLRAFESQRSAQSLRASQSEDLSRPSSVPVSDVDDVSGHARPQVNKNAYAIVIGIENYRQKLPRADFAGHDAQIMTEYLTKVLGYPGQNVITLVNGNATNVDLVKYFEKWLPNNVEPGATVFVYYSGHGAPNPKTGDAYLVPYDGDPSFLDETGYSLKRMYAALGKLPAKEVIVALDSCFSGAGGRSVIAQGSRPLVMNLQSDVVLPKNMTVLSASSGEQTSSTYDEKGHGLFTYFLLKGIKNEDVVKQDGSLKMDDLYGYLKPQVERIARKQYNNEQTPQLMEPKK